MDSNQQRSSNKASQAQAQLSFEMVQSIIAEICYQNDDDLKTTLCIVILKNGYQIISKHQCASNMSFDVELSEKIAYFKAMQEVCKAAYLLMLEQRYQSRKK